MLMPQDLRKAHESLDRAVDAIFSPSASSKSFKTEEERQKALLEAYEEMTGKRRESKEMSEGTITPDRSYGMPTF